MMMYEKDQQVIQACDSRDE